MTHLEKVGTTRAIEALEAEQATCGEEAQELRHRIWRLEIAVGFLFFHLLVLSVGWLLWA